MHITILGAGTSVPTRERGPAGILVRIGGGTKILLDCGSGTLQKLARVGTHFYSLDFVFLTHLHLDHTGDLPSLLFGKRNPDLPENRDLTVVGPDGTLEFFAGLQQVYGHWVEGAGYRLRVAEMPEDGVHGDDWRMESFPVKHSAESLGLRLKETGGGILAYTGDTGYAPEVVALARGADLLIAECSFPEDYAAEDHLTPAQAGKLAAEAGVKRLMLTHMYPLLGPEEAVREVCEYFHGPAQAARDFDSITI